MKVLGVMLIRTGSTRLPNKNFMEFQENNNPLFLTGLTNIMNAKLIEKVVVSTNVVERVESTLDKYFKPENWDKLKIVDRPSYLCENNSKSEDALIWTVKQFEPDYDTILLSQCTSPVFGFHHYDFALYYYEQKHNKNNGIDSLISVNKYTMQPNGAIYIVDREALLKHGTYYTPRTGIYLMEPKDSVDIDYLHDFRIAEAVGRGDVFE